MDPREAITDFICRELLHHDRQLLPSLDQPLLNSEGGVVDSVGLYQLIAFIESHLGIPVDDLEIVPENFESLRALVSFIERKQEKGHAGTARLHDQSGDDLQTAALSRVRHGR